MDPIHCCDPQEDANCPIIQECCQEYISLKRYYLQIGIEQSGKLPKTKHHLFVIVGKFYSVEMVIYCKNFVKVTFLLKKLLKR